MKRTIPAIRERNDIREFENESPKLTGEREPFFSGHTARTNHSAQVDRNVEASLGDTAVFSDEEASPSGLPSQSHRVPYFRYFGPTAIVPGFKQMVVSVREHRRSTGAGSVVGSMLILPYQFFYDS